MPHTFLPAEVRAGRTCRHCVHELKSGPHYKSFISVLLVCTELCYFAQLVAGHIYIAYIPVVP